MPTFHALVLFATASMALNLTPGPDMALTLTRGMTQGFKTAWVSVLGVFCAGFIQIPVVVLGLASIFKESPALFSLVKFAGAVYMLYLGLKAIQRAYLKVDGRRLVASTSSKDVFWQGLTTNLLNPKVFIFMVAFLPQFADEKVGPVWTQMLVFGICGKLLGLTCGSIFAFGAAQIRTWLSRNQWFMRLQDSFLGVAMICIAGYLVFNRSPVEHT